MYTVPRNSNFTVWINTALGVRVSIDELWYFWFGDMYIMSSQPGRQFQSNWMYMSFDASELGPDRLLVCIPMSCKHIRTEWNMHVVSKCKKLTGWFNERFTVYVFDYFSSI